MKHIFTLLAAGALIAAATPAFAQLSLGVGSNSDSGTTRTGAGASSNVGADVGVRSQINSRTDGSIRAPINSGNAATTDQGIGTDVQSTLRPTMDSRNSTTGNAASGAGVSTTSSTSAE